MTLTNDINELKSRLIVMARKAEAIYDKAVECLQTKNEALIEEVRTMDREIDQLEIEIDRRSQTLMMLRDPYAVDFRFIFAVIRIVPELERVGDQSKTIAKWVPRLQGPADDRMKELAAKTREALATSITAIVEGSVADAEKVMKLEFQVDAIEDEIIESAPGIAEAFIAKALERIGDLATNIAENVIFAESADDIRHGNYQSS